MFLIYNGFRYDIGDNTFGSAYIEDHIGSLENCIHIEYEPKEYFFSENVSQLNFEQLREYVIFWNYMNSSFYFNKGIFALYFIWRTSNFDIEDIDRYLKGISKFINDVSNPPTNKLYDDLLIMMLRYNYISIYNIIACGRVNVLSSIQITTYNCFMTEQASRYGRLGCLIYLRQNGCPWNKWTCIYAAQYGHLNCLQWAHWNGCEWDTEVCIKSAEGGYLDCLQYACDNGCPVDHRTADRAALNGHLDCLKYIHAIGIMWGTDAYECLRYGHNECYNYIMSHENGLNQVIDNFGNFDLN